MLTALATILPLVSSCATLSSDLYRSAAESHDATETLIQVASVINRYGSILKQVATIIKEDDRLPSNEAIDTLEDVITQSHIVLRDIEFAAFTQNDKLFDGDDGWIKSEGTALQKLDYLATHLEALRATLSVLLQTLYTAQSIMWSKLRPSISPQQATTAVANEKIQLKTLVIEQQMSILKCSIISEKNIQQNSRVLMEADNSLSLVTSRRGDSSSPGDLYRYQNKHLKGFEASAHADFKQVREVCNIASSQSEGLIERWTTLCDFDNRLRDAERKAQKQKQETQQPTVESDSEDDDNHRRRLAGNGAKMAPQNPDTTQPLIIETGSLPIPISERKFGPTAPLSPATSPRNSHLSFSTPANERHLLASPQSSISTLPVEAAAAVEANEEDEEVDLEIPWTLCTRRHYWKYIDNKVMDTNTDQKPSIASLEKNSWIEITASWVCKDAIKEAGYKFKQVQKDKEDGRRTRFETCFCIESPLHFNQVKHLVERTVEIYRKTALLTPPPNARPPSLKLQPPPTISGSNARGPDRDRSPIPRKTYPLLERSTSSLPFPASFPPLLDRSLSIPGPRSTPPTQQQCQARQAPFNANLQPPKSSLGYPPQPPRTVSYAPQPKANPSKAKNPNIPPLANLQSTQHNHPFTQTQNNGVNTQPPARQSYLDPRSASKYHDTTTSDSESEERERSRRYRSRSRSSYSSGKKKRRHGATTAMGAIMGVGGLTALLDGLSGL